MTDTMLRLFDPDTHAHRNDPDTSTLAAARQTTTGTEAVKVGILAVLAEQPRTAFQAADRYFELAAERGWPIVQAYSINRRMSDLNREHRVRDTGERALTPSGSTAVVWAAK